MHGSGAVRLSPFQHPTSTSSGASCGVCPRRQAQVVALQYLYDLGVADVAATLEVSEGSVKVHLSRARATLRRVLISDNDNDNDSTRPDGTVGLTDEEMPS